MMMMMMMMMGSVGRTLTVARYLYRIERVIKDSQYLAIICAERLRG